MVEIFLEPRISGATADAVCMKMGKDRWIRSEADGFSGGVWVLWNEGKTDLKLKYSDKFFLHIEAKTGGGKEWELMAVHARPNLSVQMFLWERLNAIAVRRLWMLVGDFNCVLHDNERSSNSVVSRYS